MLKTVFKTMRLNSVCSFGRALLFSATLISCWGAQAQDLLPVPKLSAQVIDLSKTLSATDVAALTATAAGIEKQRGTQIAVLVVGSTNGEPIEDFAHRVGDAWKLGRKGVGDGLLIVAALQDRRVRIDVARALEGAVPDAVAKRIINESIRIAFQQQRYAAGLDAALHRIDERLAGEVGLPAPSAASDGASQQDFDIEDLLPLLMMGVFAGFVLRGMFGKLGAGIAGFGTGFAALSSGFAMTLAAGTGVGVLLLVLLLGGLNSGYRGTGGGIAFPSREGGFGGGFGGGGFGGGGGFSSGGGGDFGGGGSSGDW